MNYESKQKVNHNADYYKKAVKIADIIRKIKAEYEKRLEAKKVKYPGLHSDGTIINDLIKEMKLKKNLTKEELTEMVGQLMWSYVNAKDEAKFYRDENYKNKDFINFLLYAIKNNIKIVWEK